MGEHRLAILLHVIGDARPAARDFEPAPLPRWHLFRPRLGRLPLPKAVEADALAGGRGLAIRLAHVPDGTHARRQGHGQVLRATSERRGRQHAEKEGQGKAPIGLEARAGEASRRESMAEFVHGSDGVAGPRHTLPPKVVTWITASLVGSNSTRWMFENGNSSKARQGFRLE